MRQLPRILLLTGATLVVVTALLVSGLRLLMPHMNSWRTPILEQVSAAAGLKIQASSLEGQWENFGPRLEIKNIQADFPDGGGLKIQRVTLALDVWQSLLHLRWQFRDLTFWQLNLVTNTPLTGGNQQQSDFQTERLNDLFLRQFDHFDLRDSQISFVTLSGQRATLAIPQLSWLNEETRHRAEGLVSLSSFTGQHGVVQLRLDLSDKNGYLSTGRVWMQADDVDVKPWLGQWMRDNTSLESARFSLAAWMSVENGDVHGGDIWLKKGELTGWVTGSHTTSAWITSPHTSAVITAAGILPSRKRGLLPTANPGHTVSSLCCGCRKIRNCLALTIVRKCASGRPILILSALNL